MWVTQIGLMTTKARCSPVKEKTCWESNEETLRDLERLVTRTSEQLVPFPLLLSALRVWQSRPPPHRRRSTSKYPSWREAFFFFFLRLRMWSAQATDQTPFCGCVWVPLSLNTVL